MSAFLPELFCIFSILLNQVEAGCTWSVWSPCSVTCGKGIRSRSGTGSDCTQSPTETCSTPTSCYATHLASLNVTATQHPENTNILSRPKSLMIDGMPTTVNGQSLSPGSTCAATNRGKNPWVRLDLKKSYLVSVVRVIIYGASGQNVAVRVGSSLTNNGNDNHQCGIFPYDNAEREMAIWRNVSCSPPVWGRYINFDRTVTDSFLEICEVSFTYDTIIDATTHIKIKINGTDVNGSSISVYQEDGLADSIDCSIEPDSSGFSVPLIWKHNGSDVQTLSSQQSFGIYQMKENGMQRLYINNTADSDVGIYSCQASYSNPLLFAKTFILQFKVDCMWSSWSTCTGSCGIGSRHRSVATFEQHDGKKCTGPMQQECDTNRPPCVPYLDDVLSVDEGMAVILSCQATQFATLSDPIRFGWFKVKGQSDVPVIIDRRVTNSTQNDSQGNFTGKLMITVVNRKDSGFYKCKAFNEHGSSDLSTSASLSVNYGPESIAIHPTHPLGIKDKDIMLNCSATGNPTPSYEWQLPQSQTSAGQTLQLSNIQFRDGGTYTCIATNTIGAGVKTSNMSVRLQVEGPPQKCNKPSVFSYEGSAVSVTVSCDNDGNSPITEYEIQYNTTSEEWESVKFMASTDGPFLVQGLMPFTYYAIRVRAANKYLYEEGDTSFSDPVIVMTSEGASGPLGPIEVAKIDSHWVVVSWSAPIQPNGEIHYYLVDVRKLNSTDITDQMTLNESGLVHNVTGLNPFTNYSIQVAAVTIRSHDSKVLYGNKSDITQFQTLEDVPSEPQSLSGIPQPPSSVLLMWMKPKSPNGIIRYYIVKYRRGDGTGNETELDPVKGLHVSINNLAHSKSYVVTVQAFTVGLGPPAEAVVQSVAITPSSPVDVTVSVLSPYSLQVQWEPPNQLNGDLQFYKVYYKRTSSSGEFSVSRNIPIEDNSFNVTELDPYTSYDIYVTVTNNAESNPESQPSQAVQERTHTAPPILPQLPDPPDNEGRFIAPDISDSNGPILYICIVIYRGPLDRDSPPSDIPENIGAYSGENSEWYIAAKYTYQEYESNKAGKSFTIGDGQTTSVNGEDYGNVEVVSGYKYSIYFRIMASGDKINEGYDVLTAPIKYAFQSPSSCAATSSPVDVTVSVLSPYSLQVQWKPPNQPTGDLQFYKVYYRKNSSRGDFSVSRSISIEDNSFDITELDPYTSYDIYVTATKSNPESQPSQTVQERTHTASPILPQLPDPPDNEGRFTAPDIRDSNGPISYICIVIYRGSLDGTPPTNIPENIGAYSDYSKWYIAAKYTYQEYESNIAGKSFIIGDGQTTSVNGEDYANVKVVSGFKYSIYFWIVASGDNANKGYDVVTEPFQYAVSLSPSPSSDCVDFIIVIVVAVVPTVILLTVIAVLVGIIVKLKRHTYKLDDAVSTKEHVYMETTHMHTSSAYGLTIMQSAKSDDENYEELSSNTEKANEPTYSSIVN